METFARSFPLDDIQILKRAKGGDGRTVEAYAAVFDVPKEIHDRNGDYIEKIHRTAFNRTLSQGPTRALYLYNHGLSVVTGRSEPMYGVPLGSPKDVRADGRGLRTVAQLNRSPLADATLAAIENGDVKGYSFRGNAYRSDPQQLPRTREGDPLPTVTRMELSLADFGPTPSPYYEEAEILALRSAGVLLSEIDEVTRAELLRLLLGATSPFAGNPAPTPPPTPAPGPEDSAPRHSTREQDLARQRELKRWAELRRMEMAVR
jgi:HK97 family phage prohead protease